MLMIRPEVFRLIEDQLISKSLNLKHTGVEVKSHKTQYQCTFGWSSLISSIGESLDGHNAIMLFSKYQNY